MRVGILGSGLMGGKLGTIFARAGHDVVFSYARSQKKLERLARDAGSHARAGTPGEASADAAVFNARGAGTPPSMLYCGNDDDAKDVAAGLIRDVGFDPTDAGPLRSARYIEPFTMLIAHLAYEGDGGPALAYRFERFEEIA